MTTPARCPRCGHEFTFRTSEATFSAAVQADPHGRPRVLASHVATCPACRGRVHVPAAQARQPGC